MAFLTANAVYTACGVTVKQRIIPFGKKASKNILVAGKLAIKKGANFKADKYFLGSKPTSVTIHNTESIKPAAGTTKSEQYSRSMYPNENLGDVRVHYFVDEVEAWQNLLDSEQGWHAGSSANALSLSIEIIGNSAKAEDNGARLAAFLLHKHGLGIDKLTTHKAWTGKNCPAYILPHWDSFVTKVKTYLDSLSPKARVKITATKTETISKVVEPEKVITTITELQKLGYKISKTENV